MGDFETLIAILSLLGSLTLFLFGMKLMSESLQLFSGDRLRSIFTSIASNKVKAIAAGFLVTGLIQSSSAVTVMLVSFVNAGLLSLSQALGLMMGANIGTTVTAWLITLFGFKFEFTTILLPVLGLSLPLLFLPGARYRAAGEFLLGFAILFLGLQFLKNSLPGIDESSPIISFISSIADQGTGKYLIYASAGLFITLLIQSSSATIALTFVICNQGYISYEAAAAMILGENLGTTITANLAAIVANRAAKRLALGHTLFNFVGLIWAFAFFGFLVKLSSDAALFITGSSPLIAKAPIPLGLSIFHSGFNLINTLLLFGLIPYFKKLLEKIIPLRSNEKKSYRLRYFKSRFLAMNEIDILQAHEEILNFGKHATAMFNLIPEYLMEKGEDKYERLRKRIYKYEEQADDIDREITHFLTRISENNLSEANSRRITAMFKITDDIESIADQCFQMERVIKQKNEAKAWFSQEMRDELFSLFSMVNEALATMNENLSQEYRPGILAKASENEIKINEFRDTLLKKHKSRMEAGENEYKHAEFYVELIKHCESLADHIINVNQAIASNTK